jgi:hypothetical protein
MNNFKVRLDRESNMNHLQEPEYKFPKGKPTVDPLNFQRSYYVEVKYDF